MDDFVTDVEAQQEQPFWSENSSHLTQCSAYVGPWEIDDCVKGGNAGPCSVFHVQCQHIALPELNARIQAASPRDHLGRQVNAADLHSALLQVSCNMPWSTAQVAGEPDTAHAVGKSVQQLAIKWFMLQLVVNAPNV